MKLEDDEYGAEFNFAPHEREFIDALSRNCVRYVLYGGPAVNVHGHLDREIDTD